MCLGVEAANFEEADGVDMCSAAELCRDGNCRSGQW